MQVEPGKGVMRRDHTDIATPTRRHYLDHADHADRIATLC